MKISIVLFAVLLMSACAWVNENTEGQKISVSTTERASVCQNVGTIKASVAAKIGFIPRNKNKVQKELLILARNEAVKLGADTIAPVSEPVKGAQEYLAYRCIR